MQGVFFRRTAQVRAFALGVTGWARNEPDGSVTIIAEGGEPALERFLGWCRTGSWLAEISGITVRWDNATGEFRRFKVL